MSDTCEACRAPADTKAKIKCAKCSLVFHLQCVAVTAAEATVGFRLSFVCPLCRSKEPKTDNSESPIRQITTSKVTKPNQPKTERQKKIAAAAAAAAGQVKASTGAGSIGPSAPAGSDPSLDVPSPVQEQPPTEMALILSEIRLLRKEMCIFKQQIQDMVTNCNRRMDEYDKSMSAATHRLTELEAGRSECDLLCGRIIQVEQAVENQLQATLSNELEIAGLPENQNENLMHVLQVLAARVGDKLLDEDIDWIGRVGPRSPKGAGGVDRRSRLVVVRFIRRRRRDCFLKAVKSRPNVTTNDIDIGNSANNKIYVNERLTKTRRQLFHEARNRSKMLGVKYCWISGGTIYIRKQ